MTNKRIGGYQFQQELVNGRNATAAIHRSLTRILEENVGQQTLYALLTRMALEVTNINNALKSIEEIAKETRNTRTDI